MVNGNNNIAGCPWRAQLPRRWQYASIVLSFLIDVVVLSIHR